MFLVVFTATAQNWPSFRGPGAAGSADSQKLPVSWDVAKGTNIAWKVPVPGLAHSSPIVWGDRIFVTTAVSSRPDAGFKRGLYGDGDASDDRTVQQWKLFCLDRKTGATIWERVAYKGVPKEKRHVKATFGPFAIDCLGNGIKRAGGRSTGPPGHRVMGQLASYASEQAIARPEHTPHAEK